MLRTATRRASLIATLAVLAACTASRGPAAPSTVVPASDASPPVVEPAGTDASVAALPAPAPATTAEPCMKLSLVPVCNPPSRTEGLSYEDTVAFFTKHGAKAPVNEARTCDLLRLGPEREEALACTFFADRSEQRDVKGSPMIFRIQRREVVRVVRNKRIVTVLDVPLEYHVLDTPDFGPDPSFFGLAVDESDPSAIVVSEPRPGSFFTLASLGTRDRIRGVDETRGPRGIDVSADVSAERDERDGPTKRRHQRAEAAPSKSWTFYASASATFPACADGTFRSGASRRVTRRCGPQIWISRAAFAHVGTRCPLT